jgi:hypothetical protein
MSRIAGALRLVGAVGAVGALAGCPAPPPPLPGGPAPEYEPPRAFDLPRETAPPAEPAPEAPPPPPASASAAPAPAAGATGPAAEWTSSGVDAPPPPKGSGDPIPADGRIGAKHLVVMYKGSRRAAETITRTKAEAQKRADGCLAKAKAKGAQFEAVVKECTDEPFGKERGGDLATFKPEAMDPAFTKALLDLKVGQVSGVVETSFGFHIILRTQ